VITLFHCRDARSFRPLWMLEEMQIPYELRVLPFPPRKRAPEYLEINPIGTIPAFFDGDMGMTESTAICEYLAARYGPTPLGVTAREADFGPYLNWLYFGEATLTTPQTVALQYTRFEPDESRKLPRVGEEQGRIFLSRLRAIEAALACSHEYLCAGRFTAADISVGYALLLARYLGLQDALPAVVKEYWQRLEAREGYQRARAAQDAKAP
jgi:glutathione S-transferase